MGISAKANWGFTSSDGNHIIAASVEATLTHFILRINVDGTEILEKKKMSGWGLWGDYPFRFGQNVVLLKVSRKGLTGFNLELKLDGAPVMPGQQTNLTTSAPVSAPASNAPPSPPTPSSTTEPVFPVLPPHCGSCGAPVSMSDVRWTGPMSAACGSCDSAVRVEWKKIG
jgi:hypothetical protein